MFFKCEFALPRPSTFKSYCVREGMPLLRSYSVIGGHASYKKLLCDRRSCLF